MVEKVVTNGYEIPEEFVLQLDKQKFIRISGLLWLANQMGMPRIVTRDVSKPGINEIVYEAQGILIPNKDTLERMGVDEDTPENIIQMYSAPTIAHGTCNSANTKPNMTKYMNVLAETRAIARCLRFLTGCALTAVEEMDSSDLTGMFQNETVATSASDLLKAEAMSREDKVMAIGKVMDKQPYKGIVDIFCKNHKVPIFTGLDDDAITELYTQIKAKANGQ